MKQLIALCDCNNFFVSCERLGRPDLARAPVVVLSANDGCVISRSDEVKAMGIKMGEPYFKVRYRLAKYGTAVFSSDFRFYGEVSQKVMSVLERYTDRLEKYSVDEAFMNISIATVPDVVSYASDIRSALLSETGIPVSIGIAETKTLAKIATERAKKVREYGGVYRLPDGAKRDALLRETPAEDVWGIGRRSADFLRRNGVRTAWDYANLDDFLLKRERGIFGLMTAWELRGFRCAIRPRPKAKKSIQVARTFGEPLRTFDELKVPVAHFTVAAAARMRHQSSSAGLLRVMIRTDRHKDGYRSDAAEASFREPLSDDGELIGAAFALLGEIYRSGCEYKKAGVVIGDFTFEPNRQTGLFDPFASKKAKKRRLIEAVDDINLNCRGVWVKPALLFGTSADDLRWRPKESRKVRRSYSGCDSLEEMQNHAFANN